MILSSPTFCFLKGQLFWGPFYKQGRVNGAVSLSLMNVWRNRPCWYKLFRKEPCRVLERAWELVYFDDTHKVTRKSSLIPLPVPLSCVGVLWKPGGGKDGIPQDGLSRPPPEQSRFVNQCRGEGRGGVECRQAFPLPRRPWLRRHPSVNRGSQLYFQPGFLPTDSFGDATI